MSFVGDDAWWSWTHGVATYVWRVDVKAVLGFGSRLIIWILILGFHIRVEKFAFYSPPKDAASASPI